MKQFFYAFSLSILLLSASFSVLAQGDAEKNDQFNKIAKLTQSKKDEDREKAYVQGKEFVKKYGLSVTDQQVRKIKEYVDKYKIQSFDKKLNDGKTAEAFALGKELLTAEPENSYITMNLAYAGYEASLKNKDNTYVADSMNYARQTLKLYEAGKLPASYAPFKDQKETTALMYYLMGSLEVDSNLDNAVANLYKAIQYDAQFKTKAYPYYIIAYAYEQKYAAAAKDFTTKHGSKTTEDAGMKADSAKIETLLSNMLDAYARTVKFGEAEKDPQTETWKKRYAEVYTFVNKSDSGAAEYLASQPGKPMPDPTAK